MYYPQKEDPYKTRAVSRGIVFVPEEGAFSESYRQVLSSSLNEDGTELVLSFHGIQHTVTIKGRVLDHIAVSFVQEELEIVGLSTSEQVENYKGCVVTEISLADTPAAASS